MRNNMELVWHVQDLVKHSTGRKLAIGISSREDFCIFMDIVDNTMKRVHPLTPEHWDVYKYETAIVVEDNGVICFATVDFYVENMPVVPFSTHNFKPKKMHKEIAISKSKLKSLIDLLLKPKSDFDQRGLIIDKKEYFDIISKAYPVKGDWETHKEDTCIIKWDGELVVASYEKLKLSDILFARFDPNREGYINFDGIEDDAFDNMLNRLKNRKEAEAKVEKEREEKSREELAQEIKGDIDSILRKSIEGALDSILKDIGNTLISDEASLDDKLGSILSFSEMFNTILNMDIK